jgi:hypothetical protein
MTAQATARLRRPRLNHKDTQALRECVNLGGFVVNNPHVEIRSGYFFDRTGDERLFGAQSTFLSDAGCT